MLNAVESWVGCLGEALLLRGALLLPLLPGFWEEETSGWLYLEGPPQTAELCFFSCYHGDGKSSSAETAALRGPGDLRKI